MQEKLQLLGQGLMQRLVNRSLNGYQGPAIHCECGSSMKFMQHRPKDVHTLFGWIKIRRAYYRCQDCGRTTFPYDIASGLGSEQISPALAKACCMLAVDDSFEQTSRKIEALFGQKVSDNTIERVVHRVGSVAAEQADQQLQGFFKHKIENSEKAVELGKLLKHGLASLRLNRAYVIGFLRYFQYKEQPTAENKVALSKNLEALKQSVDAYMKDFSYYKLIGIETFIDLAERALSNLEEAERFLKEAPTPKEIEKMFAEARSASERLLKEHPSALHIASWQGSIDGRDIVKFKSGQYSLEHLAADPMGNIHFTWHNGLPSDRPCKVVVKRQFNC